MDTIIKVSTAKAVIVDERGEIRTIKLVAGCGGKSDESTMPRACIARRAPVVTQRGVHFT